MAGALKYLRKKRPRIDKPKEEPNSESKDVEIPLELPGKETNNSPGNDVPNIVDDNLIHE